MTDRPTYWDVPEDERHALTETQLEYYCRRELADAGHVYPSPPNILSEDPPAVETTTHYHPQVDKYNRLGIAFETMEDAAAFLKLSAIEVANDWRCDMNYSKPISGMAIEPVELPTEDQINGVKQALAEAKTNKDANVKTREAFDKETRECDNLIENVREDYRKRVSHEYDLQCIRDTYAEFLKIANGEALIATRFLLKRHDREKAIEAMGSQLAFDIEVDAEVEVETVEPTPE